MLLAFMLCAGTTTYLFADKSWYAYAGHMRFRDAWD